MVKLILEVIVEIINMITKIRITTTTTIMAANHKQ